MSGVAIVTFRPFARLLGMRHGAPETALHQDHASRLKTHRTSCGAVGTAKIASAKSPATAAIAWIAFVAGFLLLTLAAALSADAENLRSTASRTDSFSASGAIKSLTLETIDGEVQITPGSSFSARVDITVLARTDADAQKALKELTSSFENEDGELSLLQLPPGVRADRRGGRRWSVTSHRGGESRWQMKARYAITIPAGAALDVSLVNGNITTRGIGGEQELVTVNGRVEVEGARGELRAKTVNGGVKASVARLEPKASIELGSVNGNLVLTLPAKAGFDLNARSMSGEILSTFNVPADRETKQEAREAERRARELAERKHELEERIQERAQRVRERAQRDRERAERARERSEREKERSKSKQKDKDKDKDKDRYEDETLEIDMDELNDTLAEVSREMAEVGRELSKSVTINLNRSYDGPVNGGGGDVHLSNLNGRIVVLAEGTSEESARSIVRSARVVAIPEVAVAPRIYVKPPRIPNPPNPPNAPVPPVPPVAGYRAYRSGSGSIVQGDVTGDFTSSVPVGDITLGRVSGRVKVTTHSGQIRVAAAGKGAELYTAGGDVSVESVEGDARCTTLGGNVKVGTVSGDARLETSGGDITLGSCAGTVVAKTLGGEVRLRSVKGAFKAETSGGTVVCQLVGQPKEASYVETLGGDVTVTLPSNLKAEVEIRVNGVDSESDYIVSDFRELSVSRRNDTQRAEGKLNGGGPRLVIKSSSGTVRLRKGPAI